MTKVLIRLCSCTGWSEPNFVVCKQQSYVHDYYAGFYDCLHVGQFWISTQITCAGPVESLHENVMLLMITLATIECVNQAELPHNPISHCCSSIYTQYENKYRFGYLMEKDV